MWRTLVGWLILLHAIAHAEAGMWAVYLGPTWLAVPLWTIAILAYLATGLGVLRVPVLRDVWRPLLFVGSLSSSLMLALFRPPWVVPGLLIDVVLFIAVLGAMQPRIDADITVVESVGVWSYDHPTFVRAGWIAGVIGLVYAASVAATRPMSLSWGSTPEERAARLAGDEMHPTVAAYRIDHAITIHAPVSSIWPWLVQLGQDRGGFYSYDWLERAIGDSIFNADRIHPEWQSRAVGDTVLAVQRSYFGGRFGTAGWRVNVFEPERVIGLEGWGTFVLQPIDSSTTRLIVRSRGDGPTSFANFLLAPFNVFVFEPMHFIMERAMLIGIRDRAERHAQR